MCPSTDRLTAGRLGRWLPVPYDHPPPERGLSPTKRTHRLELRTDETTDRLTTEKAGPLHTTKGVAWVFTNDPAACRDRQALADVLGQPGRGVDVVGAVDAAAAQMHLEVQVQALVCLWRLARQSAARR